MRFTGLRYLLLPVALLTFFVCPAEAQWEKYTNLPIGPIGQEDMYLNNHYLDVFFLEEDPDFIWICGFKGAVLRTTDGGDTWFASKVPGAENINDVGAGHLESVMFPTRDIGYCSGPFGLFKSTDGGASWVELFPPGLEGQWGLYFFDENEGVVVGDGCGSSPQRFYRTADGGDSWRTFIGNFGLQSGLSDAIIFDPAGEALAVGSGFIYNSTDGGYTWNIFAQTGGPAYWHEELTNLNESYLIPESGIRCTGSGNTGGMRFSIDGARNWNRFVVPDQQFGTYLESETSGWSCGSNGSVWYTNSAGAVWAERRCGIDPRDDLDDITFIDERRGWVVGEGIYRWNLVELPQPNIEVLGTVDLCAGETVELVADDGFGFYQWTNGQTGQSIIIDQPGTYRVEVFDELRCQSTLSQAITVTLRPAPDVEILTDPNEDGFLCSGESIELTASLDDMDSYLWSNGAQTQSITVSESGTYTVTITAPNGCVKTSDPFVVTEIPDPQPQILLSGVPFICADETITMTVEQEYASYLWSTGETTRSITTSSGGLYSVVVEDVYGCRGGSDEVELTIRPDVENLELSAISDDGIMRFEEQKPLELVCGELEFTNVSDTESFTFNEVILLYNIEFSVPRSQFPFEILPGETRRMRVCFSPNQLGEFRDSIVFPEACFPLIPLESAGVPQFLSGVSNCGVIISASTADGDAGRLAIQFPYPNPAKNELRVPVEKTSEGAIVVDEQSYLITSLGTRIGEGKYRAYSSGVSEHGMRESGEFIFDLSDVAQGMYYLVVEKDGQRVTTPVIIAK